jgi:hypothetical protein
MQRRRRNLLPLLPEQLPLPPAPSAAKPRPAEIEEPYLGPSLLKRLFLLQRHLRALRQP